MNQDAFSRPLTDIVLPDLGEECGTAKFVTWLVPLGAKVIYGERIAEIAAQGTVFIVESPCDGTLKEILAAPQDSIQIGTVIGRVADDSDDGNSHPSTDS